MTLNHEELKLRTLLAYTKVSTSDLPCVWSLQNMADSILMTLGMCLLPLFIITPLALVPDSDIKHCGNPLLLD
jgi:hypothetical protein